MNKKLIIKNKSTKYKKAKNIQFIICSVLLFSLLSQSAYAADLVPPIASAPTATAQILKSGATSASTVQMNEAGTIYLVKNGTGPSATPLASADLTGLTISGSPSSFTFSSSTYNYNGVGVANGVSSITVTPTGPGVITVNGTAVTSGSASASISLTVGVETTISVTTTETNKKPKIYLIRIKRESSVAVGDSYGGGKIAYILQSGDPGYIAGQTNGFIVSLDDVNGAVNNSNTWKRWAESSSSCYSTNIPGADGTALGTGRQNTIDIISNGTCVGATQIIYGVNINGYTDWFLPSKDELHKVKLNEASLGLSFSSTYWSSSEVSGRNDSAWSLSWASTYWNTTAKPNQLPVRAMRTFSIGAASTQATPTFSVSGGVVASGTAVTITSSGADAIYYTTDGTTPTTSSTNQATTPLVITSAVTVKALAVKSGYNSSIASAQYDIAYNWSNALNTAHTAFIGKSSAVANTPYTVTLPAGLVDGVYDIVAVDAANNISATIAGWLTVDNTNPTATITAVCSVAGNGCTSLGQNASPQESYSVKSFTGTAADTQELSVVAVSIKDTNTNKWYGGASFADTSETYISAAGTNVWSFDSSAVPFVIDHTYSINVRATDRAQNTQVQNLTFKFTNSPPTVSNVSASQDATGVVRVLYNTADIESTQTTNYLFYGVGASLGGDITSGANSITVSDATYFPNSGTILIDDEMISYTTKTDAVLSGITRGALATTPLAHSAGTSIFIKANTTTGTGLSEKGTGKTITWTAKTDITGYETANAVIKVVANDGASGSMIGSASPAAFIFDTKDPTIASGDFYLDASVSTPGVAGIKLAVTDLSKMQYRLCNNADFSADNLNTGAGACATWSTSSAAIDLIPTTNLWNTIGATGTQSVYLQVRDEYGNTTTQSKTAPGMPAGFLFKDISNMGVTPITYREYLDWATVDASNFSAYEIWYSSSVNSTYTLLTSISNRTNSYYTHNISTSTTATYNYKVRIIGANGDISNFTSVASDVPDGLGGTGGDNIAPVISLVGANPMSVNMGDTYVEPGATAVDETDGTREVTHSGSVNTSAVGSYVITYIARDLSNNVATRTRTVNVVLAPTYTITATAGAHGSISPQGATAVTSNTDQTYTITPDKEYAVATLTVDGVNLALATEYTFTQVSAAHSINVTFVLANIAPPIVTIVGDNPLNINTGKTFVDPGVTATESDGSTLITDSTRIVRTMATADGARLTTINTTTGSSGNVITYTVTGADGGVAITTRTVNVIDVTPPTISDVATPIITSDSAAIVWKTNEVADSQISYGTATGTYSYDSSLNTNLVLNHLVALTNLTPNTTYYYVIKSKDELGNQSISEEQTFSTIKVKETIVLSGGGSGSSGVLQSVYDALLEENEANKAKLKNQETDAPIISDITISDITAFGATIGFQTNKNTISFVKYGKDVSYGSVAGDDEFKTVHSTILRGLTMGTEYHIKVSASDRSNNTSSSEDKVFKTQFLTENINELKKIENVEQFQKEVESTIESILPSLVPPFIDKPSVSDITENSATVTFRTNIKAYPAVSYTAQSTYNQAKENPYDGEMSDTSAKSTTHSLKLVGLKPNTKYHFIAKAFSLPQVVGKSDDMTFTTAASKINASITDIKKDSFTVVWNTDELTSSVVDYKNAKTGINARITDDIKNKSHSIKVENLLPGTVYKVSISGINENGNQVEGSSTLNVKTSTDNTPPVVTNLKVSSAFISGKTDKVQTIVSWQTDEPATSEMYYEEGSNALDKDLSNKQVDTELTRNHTIILMTLKPGTVYRFTIASTDSANNTFSPAIRTIITPRQSDSIVDVIFKNFDDTFNFIKNVR